MELSCNIIVAWLCHRPRCLYCALYCCTALYRRARWGSTTITFTAQAIDSLVTGITVVTTHPCYNLRFSIVMRSNVAKNVYSIVSSYQAMAHPVDVANGQPYITDVVRFECQAQMNKNTH